MAPRTVEQYLKQIQGIALLEHPPSNAIVELSHRLNLSDFDANRLLSHKVIHAAALVLKGVCGLIVAVMIAYLARELIAKRSERNDFLEHLSAHVTQLTSGTTESTVSTKYSGDYAAIVGKNVFGSLVPQTAARPTAGPVKPVTVTKLVLVGTFVADGEAPFAIIEDDKKKTQDVFMLNESIFDQATLKSIFADKVEIERNGQIEVLVIDDAPARTSDSTSSVATEGDTVIVDEGEVDRALENLPLLLTQARAVPYFKEGRSIGLRMFAIKSGSLFEKIGLKNGDILKSINGNSLGDITQAMKLFETLKQERNIGVVVERDRQDREFKYQIR